MLEIVDDSPIRVIRGLALQEVGAAAGGLTDSDDINFGKPIWKWD